MDSSAVGAVEEQVLPDAEHAEHGPAGVTYGRPDRRPTWRICAAIMTCLRPASLRMTGLSTLVSGPMTTATSREGRTAAGGADVTVRPAGK
jgi:hypothetical protein